LKLFKEVIFGTDGKDYWIPVNEEKKEEKMKLWELSDNLTDFEDAIADIQDSDLTEQEKEERIDALFNEYLILDSDFDRKVEAVAAYIKRIEALTEARRAEYRRLRSLAEQSEKDADSLREYLVHYMGKHGKTRIEGKSCKVSLRQKPARVCLNCEPTELPIEFRRVMVEPKLNEIKKHLRLNPDTQWAFLSTITEYSLMIK